MLEKNPKIRTLKATFNNIKKSPYFSGLDWDDLLQQNIEPPYIPRDFRKDKYQSNTMKIEGKPFSDFIKGNSTHGKQFFI